MLLNMKPLALLVAACAAVSFNWLSAPAYAQTLRAVPVVEGLDNPWAVAFLPDGRMLITEKAGQLRLADGDGRLSAPLAGLPGDWQACLHQDADTFFMSLLSH